METAELILAFAKPNSVNVTFDGTDSGQLEFTNPITEQDRRDIRWYVETYGARSLGEEDDSEARQIEERLQEIGKAVFRAVFQAGDGEANEPYLEFRNTQATQRLITITSNDASVLSLPWELLYDPRGTFLFRERPHISVRRRVAGAERGRRPFTIEEKQQLHLLFIVSRPIDEGVSFIDPQSDPKAVLDALDEYAPGRVTCEFLRPATLNALVERLDDEDKPAVDILHFDGHGVFMEVKEGDEKRIAGLSRATLDHVLLRERNLRGGGEAPERVGTGFLVFEKKDRKKHLVSADDLGDNLFRSKVGLVVLSACQTASLEEESDPMASVAGNLTRTGIPAILAMTHSVLVPTTKVLFGEFYKSLGRSRGIAASLDDARTYLTNNPEKYKVRRGNDWGMLKLQDWFVPALFHGGADTPMLTKEAAAQDAPNALSAEGKPIRHNLRPQHEAGFFGRRRELWDIEYWFGTRQTRRISVTGFGGQGKTELALEAGRWLLRTGMFRQVVFVDYAGAQSRDPVSVAVSTISAVLDESCPDADTVTQVLKDTPTLLILDNLETLESEALQGLLTAASAWSQAGDSYVLLTTRLQETGHPDFAVEGTFKHRRIRLKGLGSEDYPDDALDWFAQLDALPSAEQRQVSPPKREALIQLFKRVRFHPLSICVLVQQLKTRTADALEQRLEELLSDGAASLIADEGTPDSLVASLQLSLERLSEQERHAVRRLGVFQGGAMEPDLLAVTELGEADDPQREQLQALLSALEGDHPGDLLRQMGMNLPEGADVPPELLQQLKEQVLADLAARPDAAPASENLWPALRRSLEAAALIEAESVPGVGPPFLRFHPTFAPMLWAGLDADERNALTLAHWKRYHALANYLYSEDTKNPHQARAIARRELPNLLHAVHGTLDARDPDAGLFVTTVNRFLTNFGMTREAASLTQRAEQAGGERGTEAWYLAQSNRGEQLLNSGRAGKAVEIFTDIMEAMGEQPSYERALTLGRLGRCYASGGRPGRAEAMYRQGIAVTEQLEATDQVKRHHGVLRTGLGTVLRNQGKFAEAREQYEQSLELKREIGGDLRGEGVVLGELGTLTLDEGDLEGAVKRHLEALEMFERLREPAMEAVAHHQLGNAFARARQWEQAEHHYRESARLEEQRGNLAEAAKTWNQLALLNESAGRPEAAETWYRKAIDGGRKAGDTVGLSKRLSNLADLLRNQPGRLAEARELAEEALAIMQTLDPGAAQIWSTYTILADIADQQGRQAEAGEYRRLARQAKRNFAGTAHEMKRFANLIVAVVAVCGGQAEYRDFVAAHINAMRETGGEWNACADAIEQIMVGERDADQLLQHAGPTASMIIETILAAINDPTILTDLLPNEENSTDDEAG